MPGPTLLTIGELAVWLAIPVETLRDWRKHGRGDGPPAIKIGRHLRYDPADVETWLAAHRDNGAPS